MLYSQEFTEFVRNGVDNYYVGIGNPNAPMLFIGKESHFSPEDKNGLDIYKSNASKWLFRIENNEEDCYHYDVDICHPLRKSWGRNTWSKYQLLSNQICQVTPQKFFVNFLHNVFTTEINDSPSPNTSNADKTGLSKRKELFKSSSFIQKFPIVVLACSDYIDNVNANEINDIFGVKYDGTGKGENRYSKGNWFFTHHSPNGRKLVIHTRQLSANVEGKMLEDMGNVIKVHLEHLSLKCHCPKI